MSEESAGKSLYSAYQKAISEGLSADYDASLRIDTGFFKLEVVDASQGENTDKEISVSFTDSDGFDEILGPHTTLMSVTEFSSWFERLITVLTGAHLHCNQEMTSQYMLMSYDTDDELIYGYTISHTIETIDPKECSLDEMHWFTQDVWSSQFQVQRPNEKVNLRQTLQDESLQAITIREDDHYSTVYNYLYESLVLVVFYDPMEEKYENGIKPVPHKSMILPTIKQAKEVLYVSEDFDQTHYLIADQI